MRTQHIIPWVPVPFQPAKKPAKPHKFFATTESDETTATKTPSRPPSEFEDEENHRTDILA
jgi:hypothetical protein